MFSFSLNDLSDIQIRSSRCYRFRPFSNLAPAEQDLLRNITNDRAYFGILEAGQAGGLSVKAISQKTAEIFQTLHTPRKVSEAFPEIEPSLRDEIVANLVFDNVVELSDSGKYVSGLPSYELIVRNDCDLTGEDCLSMLSLDAIHHCSRLAVPNAIDLAWKLYFYNRLPVTPKWAARWPNYHAVLRLICLSNEEVNSQLEAKYQSITEYPERIGWLAWVARERLVQESPEDGIYKLYISPEPEDIRTAFNETARLLPESNARGFKVGMNSYGLMRPDKFIVYFDQSHALQAFVDAVRVKLAAIRPHGVPFTAQLDDSGLLSWGVDPKNSSHLAWHSDDSWRIWICNRLASALIDAGRHGMAPSLAVRYSLARLWLSGVDPRVWIKRSLLAPSERTQVSRKAQ